MISNTDTIINPWTMTFINKDDDDDDRMMQMSNCY